MSKSDIEFVMDNIIIYEMVNKAYHGAQNARWVFYSDSILNVTKFKLKSQFKIYD